MVRAGLALAATPSRGARDNRAGLPTSGSPYKSSIPSPESSGLAAVYRAFKVTRVFGRPLAFLLSCCVIGLLAGSAWAAEPFPAIYSRVEVAPTKTSIYVGSVSMTVPPFVRANGVYETTYVAKVFPYFFSSENGRLSVEFSDEQLKKLERGETVEFNGRAVNEDGEERRVTGKATPANATGGKLKVRVLVSKRVELIFNTTYRFPDAPATPPAPAAPPDR